MIPHRFARILGVVLLLAPSLVFGQAALQQPATSGTRPDTVPAAISKLYANDVFLQGLIASRIGNLGAAALLNVGTVTGTVADGGALTSEIARAIAAEQTNAAGVSVNSTAIAFETSRAQAAEALKAPINSPAFTGIPTVPTAASGTATAQAASTAYVVNTLAAAGVSGAATVPATRQVLTSGLATGGGDLSADRTILVPKAAQSDVAAGTDDAKALTSLSVAARLGALAPLASPALVGTPTAPTAAAGTNTTQIATTAYAQALPFVAYGSAQSLTLPQQLQARQNVGARGAGILVKSAAYTVAATDAGKLIAASGTWPLTLPSAASVGSGFAVEVANTGTGKITVTPNGTDTIGGLATLVANRRESGVLVSDGANWQAVGFAPVMVASSFGSGTGYIQWSTGLTVQWGSVSGGQDTAVTFPLAFTNTPSVTATITAAGTSTTTLETVQISSLSVTAFAGRPRYVVNGAPVGIAGEAWSWIAVGSI